MLRKLSTKFRSRKKEEVNGANGANGVNGTTHGLTNGTNGESKEKPVLKERHSSFRPFKSRKETSDHSADHNASRGEVEDSFEQFAQIIHASVRNQMCFYFVRFTRYLSVSYLEDEKLTPESFVAATSTHTVWRRDVSGPCPTIRLDVRHQGYGFQGCTHLDRRYEDQGNGPTAG